MYKKSPNYYKIRKNLIEIINDYYEHTGSWIKAIGLDHALTKIINDYYNDEE